MEPTKKKKSDIILISVLLIAVLAFFAFRFFSRHSGAVVKVSVGGEVVREFSLSEDQRYEITGVNGGKNLLVIEGGKAWVEEADCPDGLCIHMGKISYSGQSVVCLPHQVVILIEDETPSSDSLDAVTK